MSEKVRKCPQCGLILKIEDENLEICPVCGSPLPRSSASKKNIKNRKEDKDKIIPLEKILFKEKILQESWTSNEIKNLIFSSLFFAISAIYIFQIFTVHFDETTNQITFSPVAAYGLNLLISILGIVPLLHVKRQGVSFKKLGFPKFKQGDLARVVIAGIIGGLLLLMLDYLSSSLNWMIYQATGWEFLLPTEQNSEMVEFISSTLLNKVIFFIFITFSYAINEIFYRGFFLNGLLEIMSTTKKEKKTFLKPVLLSLAASIFFDLLLMFNIVGLIFSILSHVTLILIFLLIKKTGACIIAQVVYFFLLFFIF
ncbi:MAG: hypothetical protein ACTSVI_02865 [Promethearchaeota archaeon]